MNESFKGIKASSYVGVSDANFVFNNNSIVAHSDGNLKEENNLIHASHNSNTSVHHILKPSPDKDIDSPPKEEKANQFKREKPKSTKKILDKLEENQKDDNINSFYETNKEIVNIKNKENSKGVISITSKDEEPSLNNEKNILRKSNSFIGPIEHLKNIPHQSKTTKLDNSRYADNPSKNIIQHNDSLNSYNDDLNRTTISMKDKTSDSSKILQLQMRREFNRKGPNVKSSRLINTSHYIEPEKPREENKDKIVEDMCRCDAKCTIF